MLKQLKLLAAPAWGNVIGARTRGVFLRSVRGKATIVALSLIAALALAHWRSAKAASDRHETYAGATSSQPIALSADGDLLAVANPDNNSVSFFDVASDHNEKILEVPVGKEPWGVALLPDGSKAFVANTVSGTVSVIRFDGNGHGNGKVHKTLSVGTEPYAVCVTPNGSKVYVANARSNTISVIDPDEERVIKTIPVGPEPRGLAITNGGDDADDETLYVTEFLSLPVPGKVDGADDAKAGHVDVISTKSDTIIGHVTLNPIADTGFKANGDALAKIPPGSIKCATGCTTGAYPNQLNSVGIRGNFAFVPNTGSSPNGPVQFTVNIQSLLSVINRSTNTDAGQTINMQRAVAAQTGLPKRFITVPWAIAFKNHADQAYIVSAASNIVVKVNVNPATGAPAVQTDPLDATRVLEIATGKNPRGILVNGDDTRAYVMNYISRDVTVLDLRGVKEQVIATLPSAALPEPGTLADKIQIGKELYNTSIGVFDSPPGGSQPITGRMSTNGWGSCSGCHPFGLSDNVVWIFASGPRRSVPQHATFDQTDPSRATQRALNWSAIFDEIEDFELNIRKVSGGQGLIVKADGVTQEPVVNAFDPPNANRNQLKVRGVGGWDALKAFVQFGIRAPISPVPASDPDVIVGRALFEQANCQSCHGGALWTSSRIRFTPPPAANLIVNTQIIGELKKVGTFNSAFPNEVNANAAKPLGADGFNPPSLLSLFAFPETFLHNGAVDSLDKVLDNVTHRSAGTGGVDTLVYAADRAKVVRFIQSIDASTTPIP